MEYSFNKFKNKILLEVLIKSSTISISLGLIVFMVPYTYYKVTGIKYNQLYFFEFSFFSYCTKNLR